MPWIPTYEEAGQTRIRQWGLFGSKLDSDGIYCSGDVPIDYGNHTAVFLIFSSLPSQKSLIALCPAEHVTHKWLTLKQELELSDLTRTFIKIMHEFCINMLGLPQE